MRQSSKLELAMRQKLKARISRQEKYPLFIFLVLALIIVCVSSAIRSGIIQMNPIIYIPLLLLLFAGFSRIPKHYLQAFQRQKEKWMNSYGEQITAVVTGIQTTSRVSSLYLEWRHPQTGRIYSYKIVVPRPKWHLTSEYQTGSPFLLWIDPEDPDFHAPSW